MGYKIAIVGRPNVGKSTLFNRLVGRRLALVDDRPGVTRDWRCAPAQLYGLDFDIIDTAGLEDVLDESLEARMQTQTKAAILSADLALFVIDARAGLTALDRYFAQWLRRLGHPPVILTANKCESKAALAGLFDAYALGFGEPVAIAAEHGEGMADLHEAILPFYQAAQSRPAQALSAQSGALAPALPGLLPIATPPFEGVGAQEPFGYEEEEISLSTKTLPSETPPSEAIKLVVIGRPNAGKSTLINALVGTSRLLTGPEAGVTRDAITVPFNFRGQEFELIDTAGMRRRAKVQDKLEKLAVSDGLAALKRAHVGVLLLDTASPFDRQDLLLAERIAQEGRACVIALNKWDSLEGAARQKIWRAAQERVEEGLWQLRGVSLITVSALRKEGLTQLMAAAQAAYQLWNRRFSTASLNRWLAATLERHPAPLVEGRRLKIKYITQVKARPPTFALWVNKEGALPDDYIRYLMNALRQDFEFPGVPIRFLLRKKENPYDPKE
jgi:GTPase